MTLYALEYQAASMPTSRVIKFDSAMARALFEISLSAYVIATRRFEVDGEPDEAVPVNQKVISLPL